MAADGVPFRSPGQREVGLVHLFNQMFVSHHCNSLARAPGRVNLIGDHIDYCGYSVLPMALEQDILMAYHTSPGEEGIYLRNTNPIYSPFDSASNQVTIDKTQPKWYHYFICGYKGIVDYAAEHGLVFPKFGLRVVVDGCVPPNAGLSSSSAMVVCAALVTMAAAELNIPRRTLATQCARSEHYIGTEGGGMDQAISLLAESQCALLITFTQPLETEVVRLPPDGVVIVANSLVQMNKAASNQFNQRVAECRLAAMVLTHLLHPEQAWRAVRKLGQVQSLCGIDGQEGMKVMQGHVTKLLHPEPYTRAELCQLLGITESQLASDCLTESTREMSEFRLHDRASHVFGEAARVLQFRDLCRQQAGDTSDGEAVLTKLGALMDTSHDSCSRLFQCSCPELERLVGVCKSAGALGSRLTGAGWGGCTVSLVHKDRASDFIDHLRAQFYNGVADDDVASALFLSSPGASASYFSVVLD